MPTWAGPSVVSVSLQGGEPKECIHLNILHPAHSEFILGGPERTQSSWAQEFSDSSVFVCEWRLQDAQMELSEHGLMVVVEELNCLHARAYFRKEVRPQTRS